MRSTLLSIALGLGALGVLPGAEAQAQPRRGGAGVQFSTPRGSARGYIDYGPRRYYDSPRRSYYDSPRRYYSDRYYDSSPRRYSYSYGPSWSYSYAPSRYHYYWSGGYYIRFDRHTGAYWYQQAGWWYRWY